MESLCIIKIGNGETTNCGLPRYNMQKHIKNGANVYRCVFLLVIFVC